MCLISFHLLLAFLHSLDYQQLLLVLLKKKIQNCFCNLFSCRGIVSWGKIVSKLKFVIYPPFSSLYTLKGMEMRKWDENRELNERVVTDERENVYQKIKKFHRQTFICCIWQPAKISWGRLKRWQSWNMRLFSTLISDVSQTQKLLIHFTLCVA